jgi:hypothetical protein
MARLIPNASLFTISSPHGHDSFLIEIKALNAACVAWRDGRAYEGLVGPGAAEGGRPQTGRQQNRGAVARL